MSSMAVYLDSYSTWIIQHPNSSSGSLLWWAKQIPYKLRTEQNGRKISPLSCIWKARRELAFQLYCSFHHIYFPEMTILFFFFATWYKQETLFRFHIFISYFPKPFSSRRRFGLYLGLTSVFIDLFTWFIEFLVFHLFYFMLIINP